MFNWKYIPSGIWLDGIDCGLLVGFGFLTFSIYKMNLFRARALLSYSLLYPES